MPIDILVQHFSGGRRGFDRNARLAAKGRAMPALLDELLGDPYLKLPPPKSTGREYYGRPYLKKLLALGRRHGARPNDLVRAATLVTALSVVDALHRFVLPTVKVDQLIVSGGGARNPLIFGQLAAALGSARSARSPSPAASWTGIEVLPSSALGVPEEAKEAYAFAILAYETWHRRAGNLPSATGARGPAVLGKICYAPPR
jgi:anhydro-N-acetylmuramic acid kinase